MAAIFRVMLHRRRDFLSKDWGELRFTIPSPSSCTTPFPSRFFGSRQFGCVSMAFRCFNCRYTGGSHEDFFNISDNHKAFIDRTGESKIALKAEEAASNLLVCTACVYDRLQQCRDCGKKAPLCMFKMGEWFGDRNVRKCIDCSAVTEARRLSRGGYSLNVLIHQCSICRHFKYLPSFITSHKHEAPDAVKDCIECQLNQDVENYKKTAKQRYELTLRQQPTLPFGEKSNGEVLTGGPSAPVAKGGLSYASVLSAGLEGAKAIEELETINGSSLLNLLDNVQSDKQFQGTSFCTNLTESFCKLVLQSLKKSLGELEEKTRLELQLIQSDPELWRIALREKLIRVSQLFSSQATDQVHFDDPESQWAYVATYTAAHASLIQATVLSGCFQPLTEFIKNSSQQQRLHVCCIGAGPGSEVLGLHQFLPSNTEWTLLDNCQNWAHTAQVLLKDVSGIPFQYHTFDIAGHVSSDMKSQQESLTPVFSKAQVFMFSKFISAVQNLPGAFKNLLDMLKCAQPGALFLFIDNAHVNTKGFIQDLVFPQRHFADRKSHKEDANFKLYTTYAELKSDCEEPLRSNAQCEISGLANHWLDRDPICDLRVNVMLAVKKQTR